VLDTHAYRFDELGWLQFDDLCSTLLGLGSVSWQQRDWGRAGIVAEGAPVLGGVAGLDPPTLVVVAWLQPSARRPQQLASLIASELARAPSARSLLVLTNADSSAVTEKPPVPLVLLGPDRLSALVDASSELRLRVPSVLGILDVRDLIAPDVAARSSVDVAAAADLARVFVPTGAYERTLDVLARRCFAVITGPPEMGKTAIARMIALGRMTGGWEAHECIRAEQLWAAFAPDRPQVFVADDAFGSTEYRPDAAEHWALELDRVLRAMDDRHWLIWTSRPAPLRAGLRRIQREHGLERFPQPAEVQVDAAALAVDDKALILFRHAKAAALPRAAIQLVQAQGWRIVSHPHFTPERIRRFVRGRLLELAATPATDARIAAAVSAEIREPTNAMAASFAALAPEQRMLLIALLDVPPGPVPERELAAAVRRHCEAGITQTPAELIDRLTDHFVRIVPPSSVAWVHPSWRDLVITQVADDLSARSRFLGRCGLEGILLALSVGGGVTGDRVLPLLRDDADWDELAERIRRLAPELTAPSEIRLLEALGAAYESALPDRARAEVTALSTRTLERLAGTWDDQRATIPAAVLAKWFALAALLPEEPDRPRLDRTWIELLPVHAVDITSREELVRFDDWLSLAEILDGFAPRELEHLGFPFQQRAVFAAFIHDAASGSEPAHELLTQILGRIRRVAPGYAPDADKVTDALVSQGQSEPWFDVRFETHRRQPQAPASDRILVERVLRDL
jgi:hypothetical protein